VRGEAGGKSGQRPSLSQRGAETILDSFVKKKEKKEKNTASLLRWPIPSFRPAETASVTVIRHANGDP